MGGTAADAGHPSKGASPRAGADMTLRSFLAAGQKPPPTSAGPRVNAAAAAAAGGVLAAGVRHHGGHGAVQGAASDVQPPTIADRADVEGSPL